MDFYDALADFFPAKRFNLKKGVDFEIVSYLVIDNEFDMYSADLFFNVNSLNEKDVRSRFLTDPKMDMCLDITETSFPDNDEGHLYFYKINKPVNMDYAVSLGFGVVKMLKGEYRGDFLLYYFNRNPNNDVKTDFVYELLFLKMYVQLVFPDEYDDKNVERLIEEEEIQLRLLLPLEIDHLLNDLKTIYQSKKGKVIPFS